MNSAIFLLALIFVIPGLLALVIGICNDARRGCQKRDGTYHSESDNTYYVHSYALTGNREKHCHIDRRNHRHDEKIKRHKSMR